MYTYIYETEEEARAQGHVREFRYVTEPWCRLGSDALLQILV